MGREEFVSADTLSAKTSKREAMDTLRARVNILEGRDKLLATMYLNNGNTLKQLATLTGVHHSTMYRRLNRVLARLADDTYPRCIKNYRKFSRHQRTLAKDYFVCGLSLRSLARKHNTTYYKAYESIRTIKKKLQDT